MKSVRSSSWFNSMTSCSFAGCFLLRVSGDTYWVSALLIGLIWKYFIPEDMHCCNSRRDVNRLTLALRFWRPIKFVFKEKPDSLVNNICFYPVLLSISHFFSRKYFITVLIQVIWWNYFLPNHLKSLQEEKNLSVSRKNLCQWLHGRFVFRKTECLNTNQLFPLPVKFYDSWIPMCLC